LEKLRAQSVPLANVCTVRSVPAISPEKALPSNWKESVGSNGIWIHAQQRELVVRSLQQVSDEDATHAGFTVLVPDSSWISPLMSYFSSATLRDWLDHHAERKADKWVLSDQIVRYIPIPKALLKALQSLLPGGSPVLSPEWDQLLFEASQDAKKTKQLQTLVSGQLTQDDASQDLRAAVFVKACLILEQFTKNKTKLLNIVDTQGRIQWTELLKVLPASELTGVTTHARVQVSGNLPPHLPIHTIEKVQAPSLGILLATELGSFIHLACDGATVLDILWEQLSHAQHPTWSELVQSLKLPRRIDFAQSTAQEVLKSHAEARAHLAALGELLSACTFF
jgi:hypothetical protein